MHVAPLTARAELKGAYMRIVAWFILVISSFMLVAGVTSIGPAIRYGQWVGLSFGLLVSATGVSGSIGLLRGWPWSRALTSVFLGGTIVVAFVSGWTTEKIGIVVACIAGIIFLFRKELFNPANK